MMQKSLCALLLLAAAWLCAAEGLRNGNFAVLKENGLPAEWEFRGDPGNFKRDADGTVTLTWKEGPAVMLIQNRLKLKPDTEYVFLADVKAPRGTDYSIYFEEFIKNKINKPGSTFRPGGKGVWVRADVLFTPSAGARSNRLLIRLLNKNSSLQIKNLRIVPASEYQGHGIYEMQDGGVRRVLVNGNFERGPSNWICTGGTRVRRTTGNFGNMAMYLPRRNASFAQSGIRLAPGRVWRLTFFAGAEKEEKVDFKFIAMNEKTKKRYNDVVLTARPGVYQRFEFRFTPEGGEAEIPFSFICTDLSGGPLFVDELYLDEYIPENPVKIELSSPLYRRRIYSSYPVKAVAGSVSHDGAAAFEIAFNGRKLRREGNPAEFSFPAGELGVGKYTLSVTSFDGQGKKIGADTLDIFKMPPRKNEVVIDDANNILVNGKRLFPISLFLSGPDILKYASARHGASVMRDQGWISSEKAALALLDKARQFGLFCIMRLSGFYELRNEPDFQAKWRDHVKKILTERVITHPALLVYDYGDEGIGNDVPDRLFKEALEVMDELDPYHPVTKTESPRGTVEEYLKKHSRYSHMHGMDIYPVPADIRHSALDDKSLASVGRYAQLYACVTEGKRPVFLVLQAFDWGKLERKIPTGLPTEDEQRYMNFDALLNGVKSILFYNDGTEDQAYYDYFLKSMEELYRWERVVNEGKAISTFTASGADSVLAKGYRLHGKAFYAVLNRSGKKVVVTLSGMKGQAQDLRRKRVLRDGSKVELPPFGLLLCSEDGKQPEGAWPLPPADPEKEKLTGDLFAEKKLVMAKLGRADWIWFPGETRKAGSKIVASKKFSLEKAPEKAVLYLTADDGFTARVNGEKVISGTRWTKIYTADVAKLLRLGENLIEIDASNGTGRCGLIAQLELKFSGGRTEYVVTGKDWSVVNAAGKASSPVVIGRFGGPGTWTWMRIK